MTGVAHAYYNQQIWLSPNLPGSSGNGRSPDSPIDASGTNFDTVMGRYYKAGTTNITFMLASGTYYTRGCESDVRGAAGYVKNIQRWTALANWKIYGAGMDQTVIQLTGNPTSPLDNITEDYVIQGEPRGIEITDLTVNCGWTNFGATVTRPFTIPANKSNVTIAVSSTNWATVGAYAYMQRMDTYEALGFYKVVSIPDSRHVILYNLAGTGDRNAESPPRGTLSGTSVWIGPPVLTSAIAIGGRDCKVERVHITNSGVPFREDNAGIYISSNQPGISGGNTISGCLVDNLWGTYGWCISMASTNESGADSGVYISGVIENNTINGNSMTGNYHGLSIGASAVNSICSNNIVSNCAYGWFCDTGFQNNIQITNNVFVNNGSGVYFGSDGGAGSPLQFTKINVSGNDFVIPAGGGTGISTGGDVTNCTFTNNLMTTSTASFNRLSPTGFNVYGPVTYDNVYANNVIDASITNSIESTAGTAFNNRNQHGGPIFGKPWAPRVALRDNALSAATILTGSATISFGSIAGNAMAVTPVTLPGAAVGDAVLISAPLTSSSLNMIFDGAVLGSGTVSVRAHNLASTAKTPPTGWFRVTVIHP